MRPCTRVGVDVTWRCNWHCKHCFYLRDPRFHSGQEVPLRGVTDKIDMAKAGGLDHVVMVGYGEPALCRHATEIIRYSRQQGMAVSMITNGVAGLDRFKSFFTEGIDHLHISSHGLDGTLDEIVGRKGAFARQAELKEWLRNENLPFRSNVTLQRLNYRELPDLAEYECEMGVYHFVLLGFLPHYQWKSHVREVAVHPAELRPYIEDAVDVLLAEQRLFTIRYHPLCHLGEKYWPYVVNARYVFFDPWEWNYPLQALDVDALWTASVACGESVANRCEGCIARRHCGGWNRVYAAAFSGADLQPITEVPEQYGEVWDQNGGLHDLNPANAESGTIQ